MYISSSGYIYLFNAHSHPVRQGLLSKLYRWGSLYAKAQVKLTQGYTASQQQIQDSDAFCYSGYYWFVLIFIVNGLCTKLHHLPEIHVY